MSILDGKESILGIGTWEINLESGHLFWSDYTYKIHDLEPGTFNPTVADAINFYHPESIPMLQEAIDNLLKLGQSYHLTLKLITAKKREIWIDTRAFAEIDKGKTIRCYGFIMDVTERVNESNKITYSHDRIQAIVENAPLMLALYNREGEFEWINPSFEKELGWPLPEMIGQDMLSKFYPEDSEKKKVLDFMMGPSGQWMDFLTCTKDGRRIETSWINIPLKNGKTVGIGQNISHRKNLEKDVLESKTRLEIAMEAVKFGVWDWDLISGHISWDKRMYSLFDLDPSDYSNDYEAFAKTLHPDDKEKVDQNIASTFANRNKNFQSIFRIVTKSGQIKHVEGAAVCFYDSEGKIQRMVGCNWDITDRVETAERLKNSTLEIEKFFSVSLDPLCVLNSKGSIKRANQALLDLIDLNPCELNERSIFDLVIPGDSLSVRKEFNGVLTPKTVLRFEARMNARDKTIRTFSWAAAYDEETQSFYCAARDLTDQKISEQKALQSAQMAALGEMASGVAHEINNPLAIIQGKVSLALRALGAGDIDKIKLKDHLEKIHTTTQRIVKIVKGLRAFSRDSSKDPMNSHNISVILEEILDFSRERFKNNNINLEIISEPSLHCICRAHQIGQILVNLLNNSYDAVKGTSSPWVKLEVKRVNQSIVFTITDSGHGIPKDIRGKLMLPFFTTKDVGDGTGLGLSISKGIAEDHKGTLVYNGASTNTQFVLTLPMDPNASEAVA